MKGDMTPESLFARKPYELTDAEQEALLLPMIREQIQRAMGENPHIRSFFMKLGIDVRTISRLDEIPPLPVQMFKLFDLRTCPPDQIQKVLRSSGTTGERTSQIPLNKTTMLSQTRALHAILADYLGNTRRIFLVIDHEGTNAPALQFSARTAGVRGLSIFSKKTYYLLVEEDGSLRPNLPVIQKIRKEHTGEEVYAFGFTYIIWTAFLREMQKMGITLPFKDARIFHSGGWKKLRDEQVSKEAFSRAVGDLFHTDAKNVIDFYGMAEQTGIIFPDCEYGQKHVPCFARVIIRDVSTMRPCGVGEVGLIEVMSCLADSYFSQAILTEDLGMLSGVDDCPCGRRGRYFRFVSRVEKVEARGCGDTFRE